MVVRMRGCMGMKKDGVEHPTPNTQHPTSNRRCARRITRRSNGCWMLSVGCWVFFFPMPVAEEFQIVTPSLAVWQAYEPAVKCDLTSCARRWRQELVFIDPIPLAAAALDELVADAAPAAIILTNANHARAAEKFRDRFSIPIHARAAALEGLGLAVDCPLADGEIALGRFDVIEIDGAAAGEIALQADGILHVGDALVHLAATGLSLLPDKYCDDAREMRRALGKLLRFDFEVLTFAHGLPLVSQAKRRLEDLLA